jgi:hypothetical protein
MQRAGIYEQKADLKFPPFDLSRLLKTVFNPQKNEKICILIDLKNPKDVINFEFLKNDKLPVQKKAHDIFYQGLRNGLMQELGVTKCDLFAYETTGGSNLELPDRVISTDGENLSLENAIYRHYDIILFITNFSATAPATAAAKKYGFRGATMHGMNDIILSSGLAVDYNQVSKEAETLRQGMTHSDSADINFEVENKSYHLHIDLGRQDAQKSHGICHRAEIANLPAGEVYFVPLDASGSFPMKFEEDAKTIGLMHVKNCRIEKATLIRGNQKLIDVLQQKFDSDPATGILGELGFGTQVLPYAGSDIQDEKIFGTFHLARGRNDHLNGDVTKERFKFSRNASHDDILFSSTKTPEITVKKVVLNRNGKSITIIENYEPTEYLLDLKAKAAR